jgi:hypothetical protein
MRAESVRVVFVLLALDFVVTIIQSQQSIFIGLYNAQRIFIIYLRKQREPRLNFSRLVLRVKEVQKCQVYHEIIERHDHLCYQFVDEYLILSSLIDKC